MKIRFTKAPDVRKLCLMAGGDRLGRAFIDPTRLDRTNIRDFVGQRAYFLGKFVFDKINRQLAVCQGDQVQHFRIARAIQETAAETDIVGAYIIFEKEDAQMTFALHGASGRYGTPSDKDFRRVAYHLVELLLSIGHDPVVEKGPTGGYFVTAPLG